MKQKNMEAIFEVAKDFYNLASKYLAKASEDKVAFEFEASIPRDDFINTPMKEVDFGKLTGNLSDRSVYMVTNHTDTGDYSPSVFDSLDDAVHWMMDTTLRNYVQSQIGTGTYLDGHEISNANFDIIGYAKKEGKLDELVQMMKDNPDTVIHKYRTELKYEDDTYQTMNIFEIIISNNPIGVKNIRVLS